MTVASIEQSKQHWETNPCGIYLTQLGEPGSKEFFENLRKFKYEVDYPEILRMARFHEMRGKKTLEVGCGLGSDTQTFVENGAVHMPIDFAERAVNETNRRLQMFGYEPIARQASALALPFDDNSFDVYYSWGVLMCTGDTRKALSEAYRVLRPGGEIILMFYNKNSLSYRVHVQLMGRKFDDDAPINDFYSNAEMRDLLKDFRLTEMENYYFLRPNISRLGKYVPTPVERFLGKHIGYCTYLRGTKS